MVYSIPHIFPYRCQGYKRDLDGKFSKYLHSHEYTEELVQKLPVKTLWKDFCIIQDVVVCSFFWEVLYGSNQWPWIAIYKQLWMCRYPWTHCTWSATSNHHRHIQGSFGGMDSRIHQCNIKTRSKDQKSSRWYWPKASSIYSKKFLPHLYVNRIAIVPLFSGRGLYYEPHVLGVLSDHSHQPIWHRTHLVITIWYQVDFTRWYRVVQDGTRWY